tara:strand:- start:319 stop:546 length:228 start_codon:yes stop_codon:yes gene_type:complete
MTDEEILLEVWKRLKRLDHWHKLSVKQKMESNKKSGLGSKKPSQARWRGVTKVIKFIETEKESNKKALTGNKIMI